MIIPPTYNWRTTQLHYLLHHCHACHARYAKDLFPNIHRSARKVPEDRAPEDRFRKNAVLCHFCLWWPWPLTFDPKFELWRDFYTVHLSAKFHHHIFNRSEAIMLTNRQTNWQTNRRRWKHPPRSVMLCRWVNVYVCSLPHWLCVFPLLVENTPKFPRLPFIYFAIFRYQAK